MAKVRRYSVRVERDQAGWWVASAPEVEGVHTQGRTLAQVRERIREALSVATGSDESAIEVDEKLVLDDAIRARVDAAKRARREVERLQSFAQEAARSAATDFARRGLSTRDAGDLLDLSHQRVHQLLRAAPATKKGAWVARPRGKGK